MTTQNLVNTMGIIKLALNMHWWATEQEKTSEFVDLSCHHKINLLCKQT
jgi:hypothetical protein